MMLVKHIKERLTDRVFVLQSNYDKWVSRSIKSIFNFIYFKDSVIVLIEFIKALVDYSESFGREI